MKLEKVVSSNIKAWGYDEENELLVTEFVKGGVYEYQEFPKEMWEILKNAPSKGTAFHRYVRSKNYKYKRIG